MADRIVFSPYWYDLGAVRAAADAYASLGVFSVEQEPTGIVVTVSEIDPDAPTDLLDSFCNHALLETVSSWRASGAEAASPGGL